MKIEDMTQGSHYVFELEQADTQWEDRLVSLEDVKPYLKKPEGIEFLETVAYYAIPHSCAVVHSGGKNFLYLVLLAGRLDRDEDRSPYEILLPLARIFNEKCRMPQIGCLLFRGLGCQEAVEFTETGNQAIIQAACKSRDIMVVGGQPGTGKTAMMKEIILNLTGSNDCFLEKYNYQNLAHYLNQVKIHNYHHREIADKAKSMAENLIRIAAEKDNLADVLNSFLLKYAGYLDKELFMALSNFAEGLKKPALTPSKESDNVHKAVYAIARNQIIYEDHGQWVLQEAIRRLKNFDKRAGFQTEIDQLEQLSAKYDGSAPWFTQISAIREGLLIRLTPDNSDFIQPQEKQALQTLLDKAVEQIEQTLRHQQDNGLLEQFLEDLPQHYESLQAYFRIPDFTKPVLCKGVLLIDTDGCKDIGQLAPVIGQADTVVVFGNEMNGLFKMFAQAAAVQQSRDGLLRVVRTGTNFRQRPALARFLKEQYGKIGGFTAEKSDTSYAQGPSFLWFSDGIHSAAFLSYISESLNAGAQVGILVFREKNAVQVEKIMAEHGVDTSRLSVLWDENCFNQEFDEVYLYEDINSAIEERICRAMSKARKTVAVLGDGHRPMQDSLLQDFYHICAGDEENGRVYY